ncbi:MAG: (2Fe-2S)-binding protein [Armatimonadetes bacterium]|nr:(2Fe-2S)-binding protein [Armatimonadota bacterium]
MKTYPIELTVNGEKYSLEVEGRERLLEVVRSRLNITGPKEGCSTGDCGACTMVVNGKPVTSCLVLAVAVNGAEVTTVEGIGNAAKLDPVQKAFVEHGGIQCGICTPGFVVMTKAFLEENPHPTEEEIRFGLSGNLCRCTGYAKIVESVMAVAASDA